MKKKNRKFDYYLFYKDHYYILTDRENNIIHTTLSFRSMYIYLKTYKRKFSFDNIKLKSMLLSEFFRDYVTFEEKRGSNSL